LLKNLKFEFLNNLNIFIFLLRHILKLPLPNRVPAVPRGYPEDTIHCLDEVINDADTTGPVANVIKLCTAVSYDFS
jgi:hypothetical protein